jgi:hypothetical protein
MIVHDMCIMLCLCVCVPLWIEWHVWGGADMVSWPHLISLCSVLVFWNRKCEILLLLSHWLLWLPYLMWVVCSGEFQVQFQVSIHAVSVVLGFVNLQYLIGDHLPFLGFSSSHDFGQIGFSMFWWPRTMPIHAVSVVLGLCELIGEGHPAMDNIRPVPCTACYSPADQSWPSNTMVWLLWLYAQDAAWLPALWGDFERWWATKEAVLWTTPKIYNFL